MVKQVEIDIQSFPVVVRQNVEWGEMDAFAHVNNVIYFRYFETGRMAYFEQTGILAHLDETRIGPILASTSCDFLSPLTYPESIRILTRVSEIKDKRFNMQSVVYSETQDKIVARGNGMIVFYDYVKAASCKIPAVIVERINVLESAC